MNKDYALFHLREAQETIGKLISEIGSDPEYEYGNYVVDKSHIYHHVNSAWNGRDATPREADVCSDEDFQRWRQFPTDLEIL